MQRIFKRTSKKVPHANTSTHLDNFHQQLSDFNSFPMPGGEHDHQVPSKHDYQKVVESMCDFLKEHLNEADKTYLSKNKKCKVVRFSLELQNLISLVKDSTLKKLNNLNDVIAISSSNFSIFKRSQEILSDMETGKTVDAEEIKDLQRRYELFKAIYDSMDYRVWVTAIVTMNMRFAEVPEEIEKFKNNTRANEKVKLLNPDQEIVLNKLIECHSVVSKLLISSEDILNNIRQAEREKLLEKMLNMLASTLPAVEKSNNQTVNTTSPRAQLGFHAPAKSSSLPTSKATDLPRKPYPNGG